MGAVTPPAMAAGPPAPPAAGSSAAGGAGHKWLAALGTYLRALLAAALSALLASFTALGHVPSGAKEWGALGWAVLLAVLPVIINALNPKDARYGRGSQPAGGPPAS